MFITRMNRLFHKHGRLAFGLLTLFIIVPFVLYFSVAPEEIFNALSFGSAKSNIEVYGKRIPQKEFDKSMTNVMISMTVQGWPVDFNSSSTVQQLTPAALDRIIILKEVNRLKISPNDASLAAYLKTLPVFQSETGFNYDRYKMMVYALGRYGITQTDIESALREDVSIATLKNIISNEVLVTEKGTLDYYNNLNQTYSVKVADFIAKDFLSMIMVNDKDLQSYFSSNSSKYLTPKKSKAVIVKFDFSSYKAEAEKSVTQKAIDDYFQANKANYSSMKDKDAKAKIKDELLNDFCKTAAKSNAQEFAVGAYKTLEQTGKVIANPSSAFESYARKLKFDTIKISNWISSDGELIENIGKEPALVNQVSSLFLDQPITNAVEGKKAYFVALLTDRIESKNATLPEVKNIVIEDYKNAQSIVLAKNAANKFKEEASKMDRSKLVSDKKFDSSIVFSQTDFSALMKNSNAREIVDLTTKTKQYDLSSVANTPDGAIIVYVEKISLPSMESFTKDKQNIEDQYRSALGQIAWMNYNLSLKKKANALFYEPSK
ncbi:MAG: SurA N-terminal domain-containing protein [Lentisphaerota bacterium]